MFYNVDDGGRHNKQEIKHGCGKCCVGEEQRMVVLCLVRFERSLQTYPSKNQHIENENQG